MHFAVVTIAVTAAIALLADGTNRADGTRPTQTAAAGGPDAIDLAVQGKNANTIKLGSATGMVGSLQFYDVEAQPESAFDSSISDFADQAGEAIGSLGPIASVPEVRGLVANMTPEKWNEILEKRRKGEMNEEVTREDVDTLLEASRERSGSSTPPD